MKCSTNGKFSLNGWETFLVICSSKLKKEFHELENIELTLIIREGSHILTANISQILDDFSKSFKMRTICYPDNLLHNSFINVQIVGYCGNRFSLFWVT